jgi:hypothetical protein
VLPLQCLLYSLTTEGRFLQAASAVTAQLSTSMRSQAIMRRRQLKTLVEIHSQQEGLGGNLTDDEIMVMQVRAVVSMPVSVL